MSLLLFGSLVKHRIVFLKMFAMELAPILRYSQIYFSLQSIRYHYYGNERKQTSVRYSRREIRRHLIATDQFSFSPASHGKIHTSWATLKWNKILVDSQHGFRAKRSTETQLIVTIDDIARSLDQGGIYPYGHTGTSQRHLIKYPNDERLLGKLEYYGIINNKTYKNGLGTFPQTGYRGVACEGSISSEDQVLSGIRTTRHGSWTSFVPDIIYINYLPERINCTTRLFADDCLIYTPVTEEKDMGNLQEDLKALEIWQDTWKMSFNPSKMFNYGYFKQKQTTHPRLCLLVGRHFVIQVPKPYLGVQLDSKLSWGGGGTYRQHCG